MADKITVDIQGIITKVELKNEALKNGFKTYTGLVRYIIKKFVEKDRKGGLYK